MFNEKPSALPQNHLIVMDYDILQSVSLFLYVLCHKVLAMASGRAERQKVPRKSPRQDRKSDAGGAGLKLVKEFFPISCFRT